MDLFWSAGPVERLCPDISSCGMLRDGFGNCSTAVCRRIWENSMAFFVPRDWGNKLKGSPRRRALRGDDNSVLCRHFLAHSHHHI